MWDRRRHTVPCWKYLPSISYEFFFRVLFLVTRSVDKQISFCISFKVAHFLSRASILCPHETSWTDHECLSVKTLQAQSIRADWTLMGGYSVVPSRHLKYGNWSIVVLLAVGLFMLSKLQKIFNALTMGRGYYAVRTGRRTGVFQTWYELCNIFKKQLVPNDRENAKTAWF